MRAATRMCCSLSRQFNHCLPLPGILQQVERSHERCTLLLPVPWHAQGTPHQMRRNDQTRRAHRFQSVTEGGDGDHNRCHAGRFQQTRNVSHGHVTHRSDGHQHGRVDFLRPQLLHPLRPRVFQKQSLSTGADEGIRVCSQLPDAPLLRQLAQTL